MPKTGITSWSQDLSPAFVVNGCFYLITPNCLRCSNSFTDAQTIPLVALAQGDALDIDTEFDWLLVTALLESSSRNENSL